MYEEQHPPRGGGGGGICYDDDVVNVSPNELANLLHHHHHHHHRDEQQQQQRDDDGSSSSSSSHRHCYWTQPVSASAPSRHLRSEFDAHASLLHDPSDVPRLDPRGPSLWMGTSGSGTQCHYDVANNAILQLHGTKRIRVYPPSVGATRLHVYPDAHPRARKSQVDFDAAVFGGDDGDDDDDDALLRERYPHYYHRAEGGGGDGGGIPRPALDAVLRSGDALLVPAFWFHHVENGRVPPPPPPPPPGRGGGDVPPRDGVGGDDSVDCRAVDDDDVDGPSVSMNVFALSGPMITARRIFASASRPLGAVRGGGGGRRRAPSLLGALGTRLVREMNVVEPGGEGGFIRRHLLEARYSPLGNAGDRRGATTTAATEDGSASSARANKDAGDSDLTCEELRAVDACIGRIMPDFRLILRGGGGGGGGADDASAGGGAVGGGEGEGMREDVVVDSENDDGAGIALLVGLHLLELWAVEMVGAGSVAEAWDDALS